jgi:DNA-binding PadR family transcriptional regulator
VRSELLKGHLDFLLLAVVAAEPAHGYRVVRALAEWSGGYFDLAEGTVYPALHRLERVGLVTSAWSDGSGRRRRVYRLTRRGAAALRHERDEWRAFAGAVEAVGGTG